ncbi:hypothetical protein [Actinoplanes sp. URMC 104]|uniref:hypothetical protein n=1 Tax=Actinoplanes sp. URMC 104 TaxID=3423409 RepID=UPI003F1C45CF
MDVVGHYTAGDEDSRMTLDRDEWDRTRELLGRRLPPAPAVGGGPGRCARHLIAAARRDPSLDEHMLKIARLPDASIHMLACGRK